MLAMFFGQDILASLSGETLYSTLENAKPDKRGEIAKNISGHDETGIRLLVRGLASREEATALACQAALKDQLDQWQNLPQKEASKRYLVLSQELAKNAKQNDTYALNLSYHLSQQILNNILNRGFEGQYQISENCRVVAQIWEAGQPNYAANEMLAQHSHFHTTLASAGEPRNARETGINVPYLVAESSDTQLTGRLQQIDEQETNSKANAFRANAIPAQKDKIAKNQKEQETQPRVGFYSLHTPRPATINENRTLIARNDSSKIPTQDGTPFIDDALQRVAVHNLVKLPTQDLMKLLNHENWDISAKSEEILANRDGFEDEHLRLATLLYHPNVDVRKSILPQLTDNDELETHSWLSELLKDPDADVRLATANAICHRFPLDTVSLEQLTQIMQSDSDHRIAALGRGLETRISSGNPPSQYRR